MCVCRWAASPTPSAPGPRVCGVTEGGATAGGTAPSPRASSPACGASAACRRRGRKRDLSPRWAPTGASRVRALNRGQLCPERPRQQEAERGRPSPRGAPARLRERAGRPQERRQVMSPVGPSWAVWDWKSGEQRAGGRAGRWGRSGPRPWGTWRSQEVQQPRRPGGPEMRLRPPEGRSWHPPRRGRRGQAVVGSLQVAPVSSGCPRAAVRSLSGQRGWGVSPLLGQSWSF